MRATVRALSTLSPGLVLAPERYLAAEAGAAGGTELGSFVVERGERAPVEALDGAIVLDTTHAKDGLVDVGYDRHMRVFSKGQGVHINGIESFWSFTKRRLAKFNGVKANFELHLKECEWRWNQDPDTLVEQLISIAKKYSDEPHLLG